MNGSSPGFSGRKRNADHTSSIATWPMGRMRMLRPRVQQLVDGLLDELDREGPPVDFHEAVSFPLPALVICELLGVPYDDREAFRRWSDDAADMTDEARSFSGLGALWQYMLGLVEAKRSQSGDDVLSELVRALSGSSAPSSTEEVAMLGAALLFAGHETTVAAIDKGLVLALTDPGVRQAMAGDRTNVEAAVEEILRLPLPVPAADTRAAGLPRWAATDPTSAPVPTDKQHRLLVRLASEAVMVRASRTSVSPYRPAGQSWVNRTIDAGFTDRAMPAGGAPGHG